MKFLMKIVIAVANIIYCFMKLLPTKKKVTFISRQHNTSNVDFDLLIKEIKETRPDYEVRVLTKMIGPRYQDKIIYGFHMLCQMYHTATSEVVVLDTYCIIISILKHKKKLKVIQIWHAVGAFKKFGYSVIGKAEGTSSKVADLMRMHENYDYVCTSSEFCKQFFAEAFHISEKKVIVCPLPRLDILRSAEMKGEIKEKVYEAYPELQNTQKKIILYAPTHRKEKPNMSKPVQRLIDHVDFDKYELIIKLHPLSKHKVIDSRVILNAEFATHEMMLVADYVITDYSAIVFEAALLEKRLLFYGFDYESYMVRRDFYIHYNEELPGEIFEEAD